MSFDAVWLKYRFRVVRLFSWRQWGPGGGLYIFAGSDGNGHWKAYYIGTSISLSRRHRYGTHSQLAAAIEAEATHLHIALAPYSADEETGLFQRAVWNSIERKLIVAYDPPLNTRKRRRGRWRTPPRLGPAIHV